MQHDKEPVRFELLSSDGQPILCEVLFTFFSDEWKAHYLVYAEAADPSRISASRYFPDQVANGDLSNLLPIESDEEWAFVERVIDQALGKVMES
jgi:uncharacterized protein YrzB (UPF0473 family)